MDRTKNFAFHSEHIRLIAGLGNPDPKLAATYHNIGTRALEFLLASSEDHEWKTKDEFRYVKADSKFFVVPNTFMNESGIAIRHALHYFKVTPESLLVLHDDTDLPVGDIRIGFGRGSAGHHGIESIIRSLGTNEFWRARIGVRRDDRKEKAGAFVLKRIRRADETRFEEAFQELRTLLKSD